MSTPHPLFTVTLSGDQLATLRAFLDYAGGAPTDLLAALDAAKPARATKPRATPAAVEPFSPNTGNPAVDEFMRRHHSDDWEKKLRSALRRNVPGMLPMPAPAPGWPLPPKDAQTFARYFA